MTQMPELVAMLHSFVGLAAVLVGIVSKMHAESTGLHAGVRPRARSRDRRLRGSGHADGSIVAFLKLRGTLGGRPLAPAGPSSG
jgi:NAD(P) transhydrogenase subunit beta